MDSIGFHPTNGYRWSPSDNISALPNIYLTSGTLSRRDFRLSYFHRKVSRIEFCLFHRKTTFSIGIHRCVLDIHGGGIKENLTIILFASICMVKIHTRSYEI